MPLDFTSGFVLTDGGGNETAHVLPCKLKFREGSYGDAETNFRTVALDQITIQVETFAGGAQQVDAQIRFYGDPNALRALLREGARGRTLDYLPDLTVPSWSYPLVLMNAGPVVRVQLDRDRFGFGEWEAPVSLRRIDGGELYSLASGLLFFYTGGGPMDGLTFTRATAGTRINRLQQLESILSGDRRVEWLADVSGIFRPHTLLEEARTQVASDPEAPNSWTNIGTPVITTGQTDPWGGTDAILVEDDTGTPGEGKRSACSFTGDATKVCIVAMRAGNLAVVRVRLRDTTVPTGRHHLSVTWQTGDTPPTVATVSGTGTIYPSVPLHDADGNLWWLIRFSADSVIAANANSLQVFSADGDTGTFYLAGGNAFDATFPSSWQGASLGTRNADVLSATYEVPPIDASYYFAFRELGEPDWLTSGGLFPRIISIGTGTTHPRIILAKTTGGDNYRISYSVDASNQVTSSVDLNPVAGDDVELRFTISKTGVVLLHGALNGGAEVSGVASSALALPPAWSGQQIALGGTTAVGNGSIALRAVIGARDLPAFTLARYRAMIQ